MFRTSLQRVRVWLEVFDDVLGDAHDAAPAADAQLHSHPHRTPLRWQRARRPGSVPASPAHCLSPVRASSPRGSVRDGVL